MKKQMQNNIDISTNTYLNSYKCKQGDIIKWIVDLSDLGASVDLTGRTVICNIVKANNTFLKQTSGIVITGSKIDITLDQQATQIPGQTKLSLTISKTGEKATTFSKLLEVEKNDTEDLMPSTNIVTIIDQLDAKILEANNTKTALDTSIANGNVAKIRTDVDKNITDIAKNTADILTKYNKDLGEATANLATYLNTQVFDAMEGEKSLKDNVSKKAYKNYVDTELAKKPTLQSKPIYEVKSVTLSDSTKTNVICYRIPGTNLLEMIFHLTCKTNKVWTGITLPYSYKNRNFNITFSSQYPVNGGSYLARTSNGNFGTSIHDLNKVSVLAWATDGSSAINSETMHFDIRTIGEELNT